MDIYIKYSKEEHHGNFGLASDYPEKTIGMHADMVKACNGQCYNATSLKFVKLVSYKLRKYHVKIFSGGIFYI